MVVGEVGIDSLGVFPCEKAGYVVGAYPVLVAEPHKERSSVEHLGGLTLAANDVCGGFAMVGDDLENVVENLAFHCLGYLVGYDCVYSRR